MSDTQLPVDMLPPTEVATKAAAMGVRKAHMSITTTLVQSMMAGGFVSSGALFATIAVAGASGMIPYGITRLLFGLVFCLGLILVVLAGAELFTGNVLIVIAWASRKVNTAALLRNWTLVYIGNLIGSLITAVIVYVGREYRFGSGIIGQTALTIANNKAQLEFGQALALGILCNALVCMAIWLTLGGRTTTDKIMAILFPITAFGAAGFEHSVANMYFIPSALLIKTFDPEFAASTGLNLDALTLTGFFNNMIPVTIGNIIGGVVMVGAIYWFVYLREK
ncbi:MAG: formate/nitrite transporter family protein [Chloroflexi bacterium]|uniref:formate/nitrite transporter family protein n=1 Tax=Candidatus Flexifilum breve TaxID=3140694 RepID=UPI0031375F1B|nr:formate/nitrite transporter family protein [Chloroflexota bacterium]